jgi:hypothetical protein
VSKNKNMLKNYRLQICVLGNTKDCTFLLFQQITEAFPDSYISFSTYTADKKRFSYPDNIEIFIKEDVGPDLTLKQKEVRKVKNSNVNRYISHVKHCQIERDVDIMLFLRSDLLINDIEKFKKNIDAFSKQILDGNYQKVVLQNGCVNPFGLNSVCYHLNDWFLLCSAEYGRSIVNAHKEGRYYSPDYYFFKEKNENPFGSYRSNFQAEQIVFNIVEIKKFNKKNGFTWTFSEKVNSVWYVYSNVRITTQDKLGIRRVDGAGRSKIGRLFYWLPINDPAVVHRNRFFYFFLLKCILSGLASTFFKPLNKFLEKIYYKI